MNHELTYADHMTRNVNDPPMLEFLLQNRAWCETNVRKLPSVIRAMRRYVSLHPHCEFCSDAHGRVAVHHIRPVHLFPELADDPTNFITLHQTHCHYAVGHFNNWNLWNPDVRAHAAAAQAEIEKQKLAKTAKAETQRISTAENAEGKTK